MTSTSEDVFRPKDRRDYQDAIDPNVYLVIHLQPRLPDELFGWRHASDELYDKVAYQFVANVSREVLGATAYRKRPRHRKRLPNLVTLENNGGSPHFNVSIRCPDNCDYERFEAICRNHFEVEDWFRKHPGSFFCQPRIGDCTVYSLKAGSKILERSISFHR